jgi:hypothetical protein
MSDKSATSTYTSPLWVPPRDPTRDEQSRVLWEMSAAERVAAMYRGDLSLFQCLQWAARRPHEVPLINDEFAFIAIRTPEVADAERGVHVPPNGGRAHER